MAFCSREKTTFYPIQFITYYYYYSQYIQFQENVFNFRLLIIIIIFITHSQCEYSCSIEIILNTYAMHFEIGCKMQTFTTNQIE